MDRGQSAGDGDTEVEERRRREGMKGRGSRDRWGGACLYLAGLPLIGVPPGEVI